MKEEESTKGFPRRKDLLESPETRLLNSVFIAEVVSGLLAPEERGILQTYDETMQKSEELFGRDLTSQEVIKIQDSIPGAKEAIDKWTGLFEYYLNSPLDGFEL